MKLHGNNLVLRKKSNGTFKSNRIRGLMDVPISPPNFLDVIIPRKVAAKKPVVKKPGVKVEQRKNPITLIRKPYWNKERDSRQYAKEIEKYLNQFCDNCGSFKKEGEDCLHCSKLSDEKYFSDENDEIDKLIETSGTKMPRDSDSDSLLQLDCDDDLDYLSEPTPNSKRNKVSKPRARTPSPSHIMGLMDIPISPPPFVENPPSQPNFEKSSVAPSKLTKPSSKSVSQGCWNCGKEGHRYTDCWLPRNRRFCFRCGLKAATTANCPKCTIQSSKQPNIKAEVESENEDVQSNHSMPLKRGSYEKKIKKSESLIMPYRYEAKTATFFNANGEPELERDLSSKPVIMVMPGATVYFGSRERM